MKYYKINKDILNLVLKGNKIIIDTESEEKMMYITDTYQVWYIPKDKWMLTTDDEKLRDDLSYLENYKLKKIDLRDNTIDAYKINKEINLVVIAYRHKSLDRFLRDRIERW